MIRVLKNISFYILISSVVCGICMWLKSDFLLMYLRENLIGMQVTLLAINTATLGLIASKIQDISLRYEGINFSTTIGEMKLSLLEQIYLIISSVTLLIFHYSKLIEFPYKDLITNIGLCAVFIYAIYILWDTGKAVFVIIDELQNIKNTDS